eukprot:6194186-Pleurochrysis_carterae.AAC.1
MLESLCTRIGINSPGEYSRGPKPGQWNASVTSASTSRSNSAHRCTRRACGQHASRYKGAASESAYKGMRLIQTAQK